MPRAIWSGAISFGLVNVPVKLFSAVSPKDVRFNQLEEGTGARIRQKRVSAETGEEVPYEKIVKGFEISPERYVIIAPEELEALDPKATRSIDIEDFVDLDQIDPVHYERPYYLVPEKGASKAYALLLARHAGVQQGGHRPPGAADQAVPGRHPADGRRAVPRDPPVLRRGRPGRVARRAAGPRHRGVGAGVEDGPAADRVAVDGLRARRSTATSTATGCWP